MSVEKEEKFTNMECSDDSTSDDDITKRIFDKDSEDDEEDDDTVTESVKLRKDSTLYVVSANDTPCFYTKDRDKANQYMWDFARSFRNMIDKDYNVYLCQDSDTNSVSVNGMFKFFVFPYMKTFHYFRVDEIRELYTVDEKNNASELKSDSDSENDKNNNEDDKDEVVSFWSFLYK